MGKTYIKEENGEKVLYEEGFVTDIKIGTLYKNVDGSFETGALGEKYHLEERNLFKTHPDYTVESSEGKSGTLKYDSSRHRCQGKLETSSVVGKSETTVGGGGGGGGGFSGCLDGPGCFLGTCFAIGIVGWIVIGLVTIFDAIFIPSSLEPGGNLYRFLNGNEVKKEQYIESPKYFEREKTQLQKEEYTQKRQSQLETSVDKTQSYNLTKQTQQSLENRTSESGINSQTTQQSRLYQHQTSKTYYYKLPQLVVQEEQPAQMQQVSRFSYLESKYGLSMAAKLNSGKIWKGLNTEMVKDSWGTAEKINRVISRNIIKEEWIFKNTRLYFENNTLVEWGPTRK